MVIRTKIDKSTTLKRDSLDNFGLNPISMLSYGVETTRFLVHFDVSKLRECVENKTFADISKLRHVLRMKNCASIDFESHYKEIPSSDINGVKKRATSFSVIAFKVNKKWHQGVGFDNTSDFWEIGNGAVSQDGATWYNATTEEPWDEDGIYSIDAIYSEYDKYLSGGTDSIIVASQDFDLGNEDLSLDLTEYVNSLILNNDSENNGLCIMFSPLLEDTSRKLTQYVGFFNEKTNTIYEPVLETRYDSVIKDDRFEFFLGKTNRLYLYSIIGDRFENLDELPVCRIDGIDYPVQQETKGVYFVELKLEPNQYTPDTIVFDEWSNLRYKGEEIGPQELEFVTKPKMSFFKIDETVRLPKTLNPIVVGINNNETVGHGETRVIKTFFRIPYTHSDYLFGGDSFYRLYIKDGGREVTVIDWDRIMNISKCGLFKIETETLPPAEYHIDIKSEFGDEVRVFKNEITFKVVSDITNERY